MSLRPQRVNFEQEWASLSARVGKIVSLSGVKGMEMYEDIYKICTAIPAPFPERLYVELKNYLKLHVEKIKEKILSQYGSLVVEYRRHWRAYSIGSEALHAIFGYLNNNWIRMRLIEARNKIGNLYHGAHGVSDVYEVITLCLVTWREHLLLPLAGRLTKEVLGLVNKHRDDEQIDQDLVSDYIYSLIKIGSVNKNKPNEIYRQYYELDFLATSSEFYRRESSIFLQANGVSAYMKKAEDRLQQEYIRSKKLCDPSTGPKLKTTLDDVLIQAHKEELQEEYRQFLAQENEDDARRCFSLLSRLGLQGSELLHTTLEQFVVERGYAAVKALSPAEQTDAEKYVSTLLNLYSHFADFVSRTTNNNIGFVSALDRACRLVVNTNVVADGTTKTPELLAKFCDGILKKSARNLDQNELEIQLSHVMIVFKYLGDKDVFQKFYSKNLARRLIQGQSVSDDSESYMIQALRAASGVEYTSKLQRMFTDMTLSGDINNKFQEHIRAKGVPLPLDFSVQVLTAGSWPLQSSAMEFRAPPELQRCMELFTAHYSSAYNGRRLNWLHHLSKGELRSGHLRKRFTFTATTHQIGVLVVFNELPSLTMETLRDVTSLDVAELNRVVKSLLKCRLLRTSTGSGDDETLTPQTQLLLNQKFSSKKMKLNITVTLQKETKEQTAETYKHIDEDRKMFVQAAIVRIMKARKVLTHVNLVTELLQQIQARFKPPVPLIKACIESLIDKEYLRRVVGETNKYEYLA